MHVANKGIKYSSRCRNKGATISRRLPGCYVDVRILFPRFKTTLKTSASCALPPGVCAAYDLIEVVVVVAFCAIRGAKRLIFFFRSDGGKKVCDGRKCCYCLFSRLRT